MDKDFDDDLRRIGQPVEPIEIVDIAEPWRLGWQRAPAFDQGPAEAWEKPDGTVVGVVPKVRQRDLS